MVPPNSLAERERLLLMARKLYRFMIILMLPALGFGLVLWLYYGVGLHGPGNGWMHAKLALVLLLLAFHHSCGRVLRAFEQGRNTRGHVWFRWFNEIPTIAMFIIVPLVVVKPF
jgi:putative membrane protein